MNEAEFDAKYMTRRGRKRNDPSLTEGSPEAKPKRGRPPKDRTKPEALTDNQRTAYEMRRAGKTWDEIAQAMHIGLQTARDHARAAERNGMPPLQWGHNYASLKVEMDDEKAVELLKAMNGVDQNGKVDTDAIMKIAALAGVPTRSAMAFAKRIGSRFGDLKTAYRRMTAAEQSDMLMEKANFMADHIDPISVVGMNAKDLAFGVAALVDKALLLTGRPTAIYDLNVRTRLDKLMPIMLAEAKRRGITIDGTAVVVSEAEGQ